MEASTTPARTFSPTTWDSGAGQGHWVLRRLVFGLFVVFAVSIVVFAATQALPSDPAKAILGRFATPASVAALRDELNLDEPVVRQYFDWLGGVVTGDLGNSLAAQVPVSSIIGDRMINSVVLMLAVGTLSIPISLLLGAMTAIRRDTPIDRTILLVSLCLAALPEFVIGMILLILFGTTVLTVLPALSFIPPGESPLSHPAELALPTLTLVLAVVPYLYRLVRASMIDVLESEYITLARLKGMPERVVMLRHALPNALVPVIQGSALVLTYLLSGIVVVEFLFGYPGLGSALTDAIAKRDVPVIQAVTLIFAAGVVVFNLVADVLTVYVTPKLRTAQGGR